MSLRDEILARMEALGRGRAHAASVIAGHGERLGVERVWPALEAMWQDGLVEWAGESRYVLPAPAAAVQLTLGEGA